MTDNFRQYAEKVVAVTGASGYIGSALADTLCKSSARVLRVSRNKLSPKRGMEDLQADVCQKNCWQEIVSRAEVIFHLAGNTSLYAAAKEPADSLTSTLLPINYLVATAQQLNVRPRLIFASTATAYGLTKDLPVAETSTSNPITLYDLHKKFAELQIAQATNQGILRGISLRLSNVYGPSLSASLANDRGVLNKVSMMALRGQDVPLYGDGNYMRDYIYVDDIVRAFMCAGVSDNLNGQFLNIASGEGVSVREAFEIVVECAANIVGKRVEIKNVSWPDGADAIEYRDFVGNVDAASDAINWRPITSLPLGVSKMIDVFHRMTQHD